MIDAMTDRNAAEFYSSRLSELKEKGKTKKDDYLAMYYEVTLSLEQQNAQAVVPAVDES